MKTQAINTLQGVEPIMLTPNEARTHQAQFLIIDVQNPRFATHMIPGAQRLNIDISLKEASASQPILLICLLGGRSFTMAQHLIKRGYNNVYVLKGGLLAWIKAGYITWLTKPST